MLHHNRLLRLTSHLVSARALTVVRSLSASAASAAGAPATQSYAAKIAATQPAIPAAFRAPRGFKLAAVACGIKKQKPSMSEAPLDLCFIQSEVPCAAAAVFTTNLFRAAPVEVSAQTVRTAGGAVHGVVINSGCANACTGERGLATARATQDAARHVGGAPNSLVMSTGVIGQHLDVDKVKAGIAKAVPVLESTPEAWLRAAKAIMTTDTVHKLEHLSFQLPSHNGVEYAMAGIAKGAGMIHPNMATMLSVIATDAHVSPAVADAALRYAADRSFNCISIDGDTSTNDTLALLANGQARVGGRAAPLIAVPDEASPDFVAFREAVLGVAVRLAKRVVVDGEGATKLVTVDVRGAPSHADAKTVAATICKSPLVKTAMYGMDANWGRIACAIGYSGVRVAPERVNIWFMRDDDFARAPIAAPDAASNPTRDLHIFKDGFPFDVDEARASALLKEHDITIRIDLGAGNGRATMWTCDMSHEYISVNADYRS